MPPSSSSRGFTAPSGGRSRGLSRAAPTQPCVTAGSGCTRARTTRGRPPASTRAALRCFRPQPYHPHRPVPSALAAGCRPAPSAPPHAPRQRAAPPSPLLLRLPSSPRPHRYAPPPPSPAGRLRPRHIIAPPPLPRRRPSHPPPSPFLRSSARLSTLSRTHPPCSRLLSTGRPHSRLGLALP